MATLKKEKEYILKSFLEAKEHCTDPWVLSYENPLPGTSLTTHHVLMIIGGVLGIINIGIAVYLLYGHLTCWTRPREQKQYVRIIFYIIFLTLITFFATMFYDASPFLDPIGQYYEGFAILALYLLFTETIVSGTSGLRYNSLGDVQHAIATKDARYGPGANSLGWVQRGWIFAFQVVVVRVVTLVGLEVISGRECPLSKERLYGKIIFDVIQSTSTGLAVTAVIVLEYRMRKRFLQHQRSLLKLLAFKATVALEATQAIIFPILAQQEVFFPTSPYHISYDDFAIGLPNVLFIFELTASAILFLWAFNSKNYRQDFNNGSPIEAGPVMAFLSAFSPIDFLTGLMSSFKSDHASQGRTQNKAPGMEELHSDEHNDVAQVARSNRALATRHEHGKQARRADRLQSSERLKYESLDPFDSHGGAHLWNIESKSKQWSSRHVSVLKLGVIS